MGDGRQDSTRVQSRRPRRNDKTLIRSASLGSGLQGRLSSSCEAWGPETSTEMPSLARRWQLCRKRAERWRRNAALRSGFVSRRNLEDDIFFAGLASEHE